MKLGDPKSRKARVYAMKKALATELHKLICCGCGVKHFKGATWHHRSYKGKKYSDFPNTVNGKLDYLEYVMAEVKADPGNFFWVCRKCHRHVEVRHKMKPEKRYRIDQMAELTET